MHMDGRSFDWIGMGHMVLSGLAAFLTIWLAHRRKKADRERRKFYWQMRQKHGLQSDDRERTSARKGEFL